MKKPLITTPGILFVDNKPLNFDPEDAHIPVSVRNIPAQIDLDILTDLRSDLIMEIRKAVVGRATRQMAEFIETSACMARAAYPDKKLALKIGGGEYKIVLVDEDKVLARTYLERLHDELIVCTWRDCM